MIKKFSNRLILDLIMTVLLLLCFSYYWLGDNWHEVFGSAFFILLIVHNFSNLAWFKNVHGKKKIKDYINHANIILLAISTLILFITSVLISKNLNEVLKINLGFTVRQVHIMISYLLIIIVSVHIGVRWQIVLNFLSSKFGILKFKTFTMFILRAFTLVIAGIGIYGSFKLYIGTRLLMKMTLDWWNFEDSVVLFFVYCLSIMGLYVSLTHYFLKIISIINKRSQK